MKRRPIQLSMERGEATEILEITEAEMPEMLG